MPNLTRYDCVVSFDKCIMADPMQKREHGEFVKFDDVMEAKILQSGEAPAQQLKAEIFRLHKVANGPASEAYINGWNACLSKVCEKLSAV